MSAFTYYGRHADTLGDGSPLAPGQSVQLSAGDVKEPHNARLIREGLLLPQDGNAEPTKEELLEEAKSLDIEGRTKMDKDQLAAAIAEAKTADTGEEGDQS
jgi:hypothetical protein